MKYYFVINPNAGNEESKKKLLNYIEKVCFSIDYEIYYSKSKEDIRDFVMQHKMEECTIFACGGDGTIHDVINGAINGKVNIGIYPCGSGNDFARMFKDPTNLEKLMNMDSKKVDTIRINDEYSINVVNIGFDAAVNGDVDRFKKRFSVEKAYNFSILFNILKKMNHKYKIVIDDEVIEDGPFLLMSLGNGGYYGGGYNCSPNAIIDDGLIEFCAIRKIGRFKLSKLISKYKDGTHLSDPQFKNIILYKRCKKVEIISSYKFNVTMDGENVKMNHLIAEIEEKSVNLICDI